MRRIPCWWSLYQQDFDGPHIHCANDVFVTSFERFFSKSCFLAINIFKVIFWHVITFISRIYIHIYTHTHTYIHMYIHGYICTYIHAYMHTKILTFFANNFFRNNIFIHKYILLHTHTYFYILKYTYVFDMCFKVDTEQNLKKP